jgi:hypothetical protein
MERLADVRIEEEEEEEEDVGNHVRKEPVPYYVNYKDSVCNDPPPRGRARQRLAAL